jgi:hypothetical protein
MATVQIFKRSKTKHFLIEALLEIIDSDVESPGEVEYDKQNWQQYQKSQVWPKSSK